MTTSNRKKPRASRAAAALVALLVTVPATSNAQPDPSPPAAHAPSTPSAADLESARELFKEGREARQSGDLRRALDRFKAAHAYGQTPVTGLELGRTHVQLGELVEAREVFLSVARLKVQPDETDKSAAARAEAADLAESVKKQIPTVRVKLEGVASDADAQLTIDAFPVPVAGLAGIRKANPGKHVVVARGGGREATRDIVLEEGKTLDVTIDLGGAPPGAAADGGDTSGAATSGRRISPVTWVGLGVGAVGLAVGTVAGVIALGKASDVNAACEGLHCPPAAQDDVDAGRTAATVSTVGFALGAAGLVTAVVGYFVLSKPTRSAQVRPFVTANALGLGGHF